MTKMFYVRLQFSRNIHECVCHVLRLIVLLVLLSLQRNHGRLTTLPCTTGNLVFYKRLFIFQFLYRCRRRRFPFFSFRDPSRTLRSPIVTITRRLYRWRRQTHYTWLHAQLRYDLQTETIISFSSPLVLRYSFRLHCLGFMSGGTRDTFHRPYNRFVCLRECERLRLKPFFVENCSRGSRAICCRSHGFYMSIVFIWFDETRACSSPNS